MPRRTGGVGRKRLARGDRLVGDDRALRQHRARSPGRPSRPSADPPGGAGRASCCTAGGAAAAAPSAVEQLLEAPQHVPVRRRELVHLAAVGHQVARLARVSEERDRGLGVDEHQMPESAQLDGGELGEVCDALQRRQAGTALEPGRERLGQQLGAGCARDLRGVPQCAFAERAATRAGSRCGRRRGAPARSPRSSPAAPGRAAYAPVPRPARPPSLHDTSAGRIRVATCPGGPSAAPIASAASRASSPVLLDVRDPFRHVASDGLDVRLELGVVLRVVRRVVPDDVDDRRSSPCARCAGSRGRCRVPGRGAAASPRGRRRSGRSRLRPRSRPPRRSRARLASPAPSRARPRSASPRCRDS